MPLINCPHCGRRISDQHRFCSYCYSELSSESDAKTDYPAESKTDTQKKKKKRCIPPGRRFLGYRHGNPLYMIISVFYHLCALTGILCALKEIPLYLERGVHFYYLYAIALAAIMLFLPAVIFSHTRNRQSISNCRRPAVFIFTLLVVYLLLGVLCFLSWTVCR